MTPSDLDEIRKRCEAVDRLKRLCAEWIAWTAWAAWDDLGRKTEEPPTPLTDGDGIKVADELASAVPALLDEVERLTMGQEGLYAAWQTDQKRADDAQDECALLRARLALLEPVWEAAKEWHEHDEMLSLDLHRAIDAAVAKEGK